MTGHSRSILLPVTFIVFCRFALAFAQVPAVHCTNHFASDANNVRLEDGSTFSVFANCLHCINCSTNTEEITSLHPRFIPESAILKKKAVTAIIPRKELFVCFKPQGKDFQLRIVGLNTTSENDYSLVFNVTVLEKSSSGSVQTHSNNRGVIAALPVWTAVAVMVWNIVN